MESLSQVLGLNKYSVLLENIHLILLQNIRFEVKQKIFANTRIFASIYIFACKIRLFASMRNKQMKHVLFASKRIYTRFIFAFIRFEPNIPAHPSQ
jgi:hypothetical protein